MDAALEESFQNQLTTRKSFPFEVTEACLRYPAIHGLNSPEQMASWFSSEGKYFKALFDPATLSLEVAAKAAVALKSSDPEFFIHFLKAAAVLQAPDLIIRALSLLPALGDYGQLLPLLRTFGRHPDQRVRSKAVKMLCTLRPNKSLIERQMLSDEPRIRAGAIEALWYVNSRETPAILRSALADSHHRVFTNALVGLHLQPDGLAFENLTALAVHPDPLFRTAMAWAFGFMLDLRAIPVLESLATDCSVMVKKRALQSLLALQSLPLQSEEERPSVELDRTPPLSLGINSAKREVFKPRREFLWHPR